MSLSKPIKILVGVATLFVFLLPIGFILLWMLMAFSMATNTTSSNFPFQAFDAIFAFAFPLVCFLNILIYGLVGFYVFHAIKNNRASDVVRTISLLTIFFFPYFGMPFYYIVYIYLPEPPSWALKQQPNLTS
jgi:hypothetical protein